MNVVVVEDSAELSAIVQRVLEENGMTVHVASEALTGLELVRSQNPEVVILDVTLPGMDGIEACRQLRTFSDAYVLMVTARDSEVDRLVGLSVGADDYVIKPFYARELVARIRAMQRRPRSGPPETGDHRKFGSLVIDLAAREVTVGGEPVELSLTEYEVLAALSATPRVSLSRRQLLEHVRGPNWFGDDHLIDVHVSNLRRKLGDDPGNPRFVKTVRGYGFRMGTGELG
jgi:DNA-binding response OmpR family regulator